ETAQVFHQPQHPAHANSALAERLTRKNSGEHRQMERSLGRWLEYHALLVDERPARHPVAGQLQERCRLALRDSYEDAIGPNSHDGGVAHPAHVQQRLPALGQRKQIEAAAVVAIEKPQDLPPRSVPDALQFQVRTLEAVIRRAGEEEARVAYHEPLELLRRVDSAGQRRTHSDEDRAVAQDHPDARALAVLRACLRRHLGGLPQLFEYSLAYLPDAARAERQHQILVPDICRHHVRSSLDSSGKFNAAMTEIADALGEQAAGDA